MRLDRRRMLVLALVGLALLTNTVWFVPNEDEPQYTYERVEVTVEDGEITYASADSPVLTEYNDIAAIDCQRRDDNTRVCGFDAYLAANGPVNVSDSALREEGYDQREFVELEDGYYRRVQQRNESGGYTFDVEQTEPSAVVDEISQNVTEYATEDGRGDSWVGVRAATEGQVTTLATPSSVQGVGEVYRVNDIDYLVVVTDRTRLDRIPVPLPPRELFTGLGVLVLAGLGIVVLRDHLADLRERLSRR